MATIKQAWGTRTPLTITLASLATDANLLSGRESTAFDFTGVDCADALIDGKVTTGTSPTASKQIQVYAVASMDGTTWPDVFDGTDSAETVTSADVRNGCCRVVAVLGTGATSNATYPFAPASVRDLFGALPRKLAVFVVHDTGVALHATGSNHEVAITPVYYTST